MRRRRGSGPNWRSFDLLTHCIDDHDRFLLRQWLELLEVIESKIAESDQQIEQKVVPYQEARTRRGSPVLIVSPRAALWQRLGRIWISSLRLAISAHG
jgi:hypothetical protein